MPRKPKKGGVIKSTRVLRKRPPKKQVSVILACAALIKQAVGRSDIAKLKLHLEALSKYKQDNEARQAIYGDSKARITEAKGEIAATQHMMEQYPAYQIMQGFSPGTGFDQVWYDPTANAYMIVEAKGPGAQLSKGAKKGDQMSKEWVTNTLNEIINSKKSTPDDIEHAKAMLKGINSGPPPRVEGRVIEATKADGSHELPAYDVPDSGTYHYH